MYQQELFSSQCVCPALDTLESRHHQHLLTSSTDHDEVVDQSTIESHFHKRNTPQHQHQQQDSDDTFEMVDQFMFRMEDLVPLPRIKTSPRRINLPKSLTGNLLQLPPSPYSIPSSPLPTPKAVTISRPAALTHHVGLSKTFKFYEIVTGADKPKPVTSSYSSSSQTFPSSFPRGEDPNGGKELVVLNDGEFEIIRNFEDEVGLVTLEEEIETEYNPLDLEPEVFVGRP